MVKEQTTLAKNMKDTLPTEEKPDTEVVAKARGRRYTTEYKY